MSVRKNRRAQLERHERPTALPSRTHWASRPQFIKSGSRVFDEVFRIGLAFPFGVATGYLVFDMRDVGKQEDGLVAFELLVIIFGIGLIASVAFSICWAYLRNEAYAQARREKRDPPDPMRFLGRISLTLGFLAYCAWRSLQAS